MMLTWKLELRTWESSGSSSASVLEVIKCLSAGVITVLLFIQSRNHSEAPNEISFDINFGGIKVPI
jgi:hypothetical protein